LEKYRILKKKLNSRVITQKNSSNLKVVESIRSNENRFVVSEKCQESQLSPIFSFSLSKYENKTNHISLSFERWKEMFHDLSSVSHKFMKISKDMTELVRKRGQWFLTANFVDFCIFNVVQFYRWLKK
jgi:hypothetical protein